MKILDNVRIGIAGLGGLGSHIAVLLACSGVKHLHLVDFDMVDQSNLQRQHYFCGIPANIKRTRLPASCVK